MTKKIITAILIILGIFLFAKFEAMHNQEYNAHVCAVYGYEPDCKTPLSIERRLK